MRPAVSPPLDLTLGLGLSVAEPENCSHLINERSPNLLTSQKTVWRELISEMGDFKAGQMRELTGGRAYKIKPLPESAHRKRAVDNQASTVRSYRELET